MDSIKILCIVTPDIIDNVKRVADAFDNIVVHLMTYQDPSDVVDLVASNGFDVILLGGPLAYNITKENIRPRSLARRISQY